MITSPREFSWKDSTTWKVFLYCFIAFLFLAIAVTVIHSLVFYRNEVNHFENDLSLIKELHIPVIVSSLWITDYEHLENQIEGIAQFNFIDRVEVHDEDQHLWVAGKDVQEFQEPVTYKLIYTYRDIEQDIGDIILYTNSEQIKSVIIDNAYSLFLIQLLLAFILSSIMAGSFYIVIGKNLIRIAQFIKTDHPGENSQPLTLQRNFKIKDELQMLIDYLNEMRHRIRIAVQEVKELSYTDQLTGLYNRRFFEEELKRLDTLRNLPLSLIMVDVNGLKLTNDAFGHEAGDQLLQKVAQVLKDECRTDDIISRIGGDEFVILLPKTDHLQVASLGDRLIEAIHKKKIRNLPVSASFGWETKKGDKEDINSVFKRAEDYMYSKKAYKKDDQRQQSLQIIIDTLFNKESRERDHARRVSETSVAIGSALGLSEAEIKELKVAGEYHDIGKIAIHSDTLNKRGPLTDSEWKEIKRHPELSYNILSSVNEYGPIAEIVFYHHERWDGKGYPSGHQGKEIPLQSRIIMVADAYDAMTDDRPYRKALSKEEAVTQLKKGAGSQFDPKIVEVFLKKVLSV
ncbi:MAG: diguanylate cyclase [Atribacterota bacterium]|nr:diguanylate cyclase [Atribacterota bacterium]